MLKKTIIIVSAIAIGLLIGILFFKREAKPTFPIIILELGFPLKLLKDEEVSKSFISWNGEVLISPEDYSRENLEKLFLWYSTRHPKQEGTISLVVFTNEKNVENYRGFIGLPAPNVSSEGQNSALYFRDERDGSEYYDYFTDPLKQDHSERVYLKKTPINLK